MSSDSTAPRPEPGPSYSCDHTTRLSHVVDITDPYDCITTYRYSMDRPRRSSKSTMKTIEQATTTQTDCQQGKRIVHGNHGNARKKKKLRS